MRPMDFHRSTQKQETDPSWLAFQAAALRYRDDESWRSRIDSGDKDAMAALMADIALVPAPGARVRVRANDAGTFHFILPPDPNVPLSDDTLTGIAGGAQASSAGSLSSIGTVGCSTCPSSIGTAGSASTAAANDE